jgi:tRNA threonylcarbamoyladenosine biosynthesis protein TsaE
MLTLNCNAVTPKAPELTDGIIQVMTTVKTIEVESDIAMKMLGEKLGALLTGGEVIELVGDVGAGKTTFVKGLARGLAIDEEVQSPSFTISRVYDARDNLQLAHYDFYRLNDAGIMANELAETAQDLKSITVIEWADIVEGVLPEHRVRIVITAPTETTRNLTLDGPTELLEKL